MELFVYNYCLVDKFNQFIRLYCYNDDKQIIAINVKNYKPFVHIDYYDCNVDDLKNSLTNDYGFKIDECKVIDWYSYSELRVEKVEHGYKMLPKKYIRISFNDPSSRSWFINQFKSDRTMEGKVRMHHKGKHTYINVNGLQFEIRCHDVNIEAQHQFVTVYDLPQVGWITVKGLSKVSVRGTREKSVNYEFNCDLLEKGSSFHPLTRVKKIPLMTCCAWDIETNTDNPNIFPDGSKPDQFISCIGMVVHEIGGKTLAKIAVSLKKPNPNIIFGDLEIIVTHVTSISSFSSTVIPGRKDDIVHEVLWCDNEELLLYGFVKRVEDYKCTLLSGHNIMGFDIDYLFVRGKKILGSLNILCMNKKTDKFDITIIKLAKQVLKKDENGKDVRPSKIFNIEGRLTLDLLPYIYSQQFKLPNYKLDTIARAYLPNAHKDSMTAKGIFLPNAMCKDVEERGLSKDHEHYKIAMNAMGILNKYCVQDSNLIPQLFERLKIMTIMITSCNMTNIDLVSGYARGKMCQIYNFMYKMALKNKIVLEYNKVDPFKIEGKYSGAIVLEPERGCHLYPVSLDFSSLYPNIIDSNGLSMDLLVRNMNGIRQEDININEWNEHVNCDCPGSTKAKVKDVRCSTKRFVFLKKELIDRLPLMSLCIERGINGRKECQDKKRILENKLDTCKPEDKEQIEYEIEVLDKEQASLKVIVNSLYGVAGAKEGMLQQLPVSMTCTYIGRTYILKTEETVNNLRLGFLLYQVDTVLANKDYWISYHHRYKDDFVKALNIAERELKGSMSYLRNLDSSIVMMKRIYGDTDSIQPALNVKDLLLFTDTVFDVQYYDYDIDTWKLKKRMLTRSTKEDYITMNNIVEYSISIIHGKQYIIVNNVPVFDIDLGYPVSLNNDEPIFYASVEKIQSLMAMVDIYMNTLELYPEGVYIRDEGRIFKFVNYYSAKMYEGFPLLSDKQAKKRAEDELKLSGLPYSDDKLRELGNLDKIYVKGTFLARRTGCGITRSIISNIHDLHKIFSTQEKLRDYVFNAIIYLLRGFTDIPDSMFVMSQKLGSDYKGVKPAHAVLADRMNARGDIVQVNERIEYEYTFPEIIDFDKVKKHEYIENPDYIKKHKLPRSYLRYIRDMVNSISGILNIRHEDTVLIMITLSVRNSNTCLVNKVDSSIRCKNEGSTLCDIHKDKSFKKINKIVMKDDLDDSEEVTIETCKHIRLVTSSQMGTSSILITEVKRVPYTKAIYQIALNRTKVIQDLKLNVFGPVLYHSSRSKEWLKNQ